MQAGPPVGCLRTQAEIISAFGCRCGVAFFGKGWAITCKTRPASNRATLGADEIISAWVLSQTSGPGYQNE